MVDQVKHKKQSTNIPFIDDNKTESSKKVAAKKNGSSDKFLASKNSFSKAPPTDNLYFKFDDPHLTKKEEDRLQLSFKQGVERQAKEVEKSAENKPVCEIFEFDEKMTLNENIPGVNMGFLDRLFHQITRPPPSESDYLSDDVFVETEDDETSIKTVTNSNTNVGLSKSKSEGSFMEHIRLFFTDLNEETEVIRGVIDEDTLFNRRSRKAKQIHPSIQYNQITSL
ncbi:unnamed protein product [Adineta steineri]|uniref:Uncharacterized protein n=1 Tax=Adineta steineri TaxID=433720 RepID=A0A815T274_9BILA|nr:unnamed protein product [Adineta steineri]